MCGGGGLYNMVENIHIRSCSKSRIVPGISITFLLLKSLLLLLNNGTTSKIHLDFLKHKNSNNQAKLSSDGLPTRVLKI